MAKSTNKQVVLHPIMFALYPAVFLYTGHKTLLGFSVVYAPAAVCIVFASVIWIALTRMLGDWNRAAIATSALIMMLFSYRPIANAMHGGMDTWSMIIAACVVSAIVVAAYALRAAKHLGGINYGLNMASLLLVGGPLLQAGIWNYSTASLASLMPDQTEFRSSSLPAGTTEGPDIYYLVLDGYGRQDFLADEYGFDNSEMVEALEKRGFVIADSAVANYPYTLASVNSSLSFTYLQDVFGEDMAVSPDERFLRELLQDSRAVRMLKSVGYRIVSFESEYWGANIGNVDVDLKEWWFLSGFNARVLQMTVLPAILQAAGFPIFHDLHALRTLYPFEHMRDAVDVSGPKFVYAHTFFAHPPFVFGPDGARTSPSGDYMWDYDPAAGGVFEDEYRDQVNYLNQHLLKAVDEILANSQRESIIIMHGDHGPSKGYDAESLQDTDIEERYSIFYAARFPNGGNEDVYDSISPVNGLRLVFNRYFGADYDLLSDRSYFAAQSMPYAYVQVPSAQPADVLVEVLDGKDSEVNE